MTTMEDLLRLKEFRIMALENKVAELEAKLEIIYQDKVKDQLELN